MLSLSRLFSFSSVVFVAGLLAGCGASVPEATDEEIIALVGEARDTFSRDENSPLVIIKRTVECAEMLSGLNAEIIKDMPAEMLGMIKTKCRQQFDQAVKDSARNTKNFKLEHFENKDFAKRIAVAAEKSEELYKEYGVKRKEEEKARRWKEKEEELTAARAEFEQSLENYEARVDDIIALCVELDAARQALREKGDTYMAQWGTMDICDTSGQNMLAAADENRAKWAAVEVVEGSWGGASYTKPDINDFRIGSTKGLENYIGDLQRTIDSLKRALDH